MEKRDEQFRLEDYVVGPLRTLIYVPDFISAAEEAELLHHIHGSPLTKWKSLKNRRLQNWGGVVHEKGLLPQKLPQWITKITERICMQTGLFPSQINHVLINEYLPNQGIMDGPAYFPVVAIISLGSPVVINFNPHPRWKDGTKEMSEGLAVSGQSIIESIKQAEQYDAFSLLLMPRSLLIFKDDAYAGYLHGIEDSEVHSLGKVVNTSEVRQLSDQTEGGRGFELGNDEHHQSILRTASRISLTCRLVLKVHKNLFKF